MRAASLATRAAALALVAASTTACIGVPSPLAPGLRGSVGVPHQGVLTDGVALPKRGTGYVLFRDDGVRWGSTRLVSVLEVAAADVASARPGSPALVIGDLSERWGGETERHRSHRTGRDVDILFFVTTPAGVPVRSPGFVKIGPDGLGKTEGGKYLRFDVDRSWLLVKSFLEHEDVQWIFVARWLEALIIEHAMALDEDLHLLWRAQVVMRQPGDSAAHDDHFHVRLACSADEMIGGCDGGPRWPWQPALPELVMTDEELLRAILDET